MRSRLVSVSSVLAGCVLLVAAVCLLLDNVSVDVSARDLDSQAPAGRVGCVIAPWDAGVNGNRDGPGGEHSTAYVREVAAECYAANTERFKAGAGIGLLAVLLLGLGGVIGRDRSASSPATGSTAT